MSRADLYDAKQPARAWVIWNRELARLLREKPEPVTIWPRMMYSSTFGTPDVALLNGLTRELAEAQAEIIEQLVNPSPDPPPLPWWRRWLNVKGWFRCRS